MLPSIHIVFLTLNLLLVPAFISTRTAISSAVESTYVQIHEYPCSPLVRPPSSVKNLGSPTNFLHIFGRRNTSKTNSEKAWVSSKNFCDVLGYRLPTKDEFLNYCRESRNDGDEIFNLWAAVTNSPNSWVEIPSNKVSSSRRGETLVHYNQQAWSDLVLSKQNNYIFYCAEDTPTLAQSSRNKNSIVTQRAATFMIKRGKPLLVKRDH